MIRLRLEESGGCICLWLIRFGDKRRKKAHLNFFSYINQVSRKSQFYLCAFCEIRKKSYLSMTQRSYFMHLVLQDQITLFLHNCYKHKLHSAPESCVFYLLNHYFTRRNIDKSFLIQLMTRVCGKSLMKIGGYDRILQILAVLNSNQINLCLQYKVLYTKHK